MTKVERPPEQHRERVVELHCAGRPRKHDVADLRVVAVNNPPIALHVLLDSGADSLLQGTPTPVWAPVHSIELYVGHVQRRRDVAGQRGLAGAGRAYNHDPLHLQTRPPRPVPRSRWMATVPGDRQLMEGAAQNQLSESTFLLASVTGWVEVIRSQLFWRAPKTVARRCRDSGRLWPHFVQPA